MCKGRTPSECWRFVEWEWTRCQNSDISQRSGGHPLERETVYDRPLQHFTSHAGHLYVDQHCQQRPNHGQRVKVMRYVRSANGSRPWTDVGRRRAPPWPPPRPLCIHSRSRQPNLAHVHAPRLFHVRQVSLSRITEIYLRLCETCAGRTVVQCSASRTRPFL